jgi:hypothetical protein
MQWFVSLMEELGIECLVGHPAEIRAAEPRKQKHDRRDADLLLSLLVEERFPAIWLPTKELLDLWALLRQRRQRVCLRVKIQNALQAIALANGLRRGIARRRVFSARSSSHSSSVDPRRSSELFRLAIFSRGLTIA